MISTVREKEQETETCPLEACIFPTVYELYVSQSPITGKDTFGVIYYSNQAEVKKFICDISTNRELVIGLIEKLNSLTVSEIHIWDVVEDFPAEI